MDENPYETPRVEAFRETPRDNSELERRVAELEKLVSESWFIRRSTAYRIMAVWGYFLLGYAVIAVIAVPIVMFVEWMLP